MNDRTHKDLGAKVAAIVDDAIADLLLLGMDSKDAAAFMMAVQATLRIDDNAKRRELEKYVSELVWDVDDTTEGKC
jgi:hypothetical protein